MNHNPQRKSIWQMLLITIRYATVIVASVYVIYVSGQLAFHMAIPMQGKSSADVGVAVYEHSERGVALWLVVFPMFSYVFLFLIKQALCKNSNLPYWIGGIASIPCALFYLWFLNW